MRESRGDQVGTRVETRLETRMGPWGTRGGTRREPGGNRVEQRGGKIP